MPRKPIPAAESLAPLPFPEKGLDVSEPLTKQPPGTTAVGQNVRLYDALGQRARGGSRSGLSKYVPEQLVYSTILQEMIAWWPLTEATGTRADLLNVYPLTPATVLFDPGTILPTGGPGPAGTGPATVFPIFQPNPLVAYSYLYTTQEVLNSGVPLTIAGWVQYSNQQGGGPTTFLFFAFSWTFVITSTGAISISGANSTGLSPAGALTPGVWHHVAITMTFDFLAVYLDGSGTPLLAMSTPGRTFQDPGTNPVSVGAGAFATGTLRAYQFALGDVPFAGKPAAVSMVAWAAWGRVLHVNEISVLYNNGNGTTLKALVAASTFDAPPGQAVLQVIQDLNTVVSVGTCLETTSANYQEGDAAWNQIAHTGTYVLAYSNGTNPWKMSAVLGVDTSGGTHVSQPTPGTPTGDGNFGATLLAPIGLPRHYQVLAYWQPGAFPYSQGDWQDGSAFPGFAWMATNFPLGVQDAAFGFPSATTPGFTVPDATTQHGLPIIPFWTVPSGAVVCCQDSTFLRVEGVAVSIQVFSEPGGVNGTMLPCTLDFTVALNGEAVATGSLEIDALPAATKVWASRNFILLTDSRAVRYFVANFAPPGNNSNMTPLGPNTGSLPYSTGEWEAVSPRCGAFVRNASNNLTVSFNWNGFTAHAFGAGTLSGYFMNMQALRFNRFVGAWQWVPLANPAHIDPFATGRVFNSLDLGTVDFGFSFGLPQGPNWAASETYAAHSFGPNQQLAVQSNGFVALSWIDNTINN